ncbi:MAG: extracellular solute-binding protein [Clostridia bacterium]|nr:extracellular solute-binding protein [Clostridia bacterium]
MSKKVKKRLTVLGIILAAAALLVLLANVLPGSGDSRTVAGEESEFVDATYQSYLSEHGFDGTFAQGECVFDLKNYTGTENLTAEIVGESLKIGETGDVTVPVSVAETGFYNIEITYLNIEGTTATPERGMLIDGEQPFDGLSQISFYRQWKNSADGTIVNKRGSEVRPSAVEVFSQQTFYLADSQRRTLTPYAIYFEAGEHTITFTESKEPLQIDSIALKKAPEYMTYEEYLTEGISEYDGENIVCQAERAEGGTVDIIKTSPTIGTTSDYSSMYTVPTHTYKVMLNTIGGTTWVNPGDAIEWTVNVPSEGYYQLAFRARQNTNRGVMSFRRLRINGEVPFKEAEEIGFSFSGGFQNYVLSLGDEPMLLHLNEGENTISLEIVLGDFAYALSTIEDSVIVLNDMYRRILQITGTVPDRYIDYELDTKIEDFEETMTEQYEKLMSVVDNVVAITGEKGERTVTIEKAALQLKRFAEEPDRVKLEISDFKSNVSSLGTWMLNIAEMPLEVDSFTLSAPKAVLKSAEPNMLLGAWNEFKRFMATFLTNTSQIASNTDSTDDAIMVWIASGRDQAQIIQNLIDDSYIPNSGKSVKFQLTPAGVLLPATLAGTGPDVSLAMAQASIVDFAVRNAVTDLTVFDDFEEQAAKFKTSAIEAVTYNGGIYGLPETQSFSMLFYRKDILDSLGLEVPQTWDEVREMISVLHTNQYDFYIPTTGLFSTLVIQNGGDMYSGEGSDYGIQSGLSSEEAMVAFKELTEFFTAYKLPVSADFSNRFRVGEIPIGIADYTTFNQLEIFAPEIKGLWSFAPLPGVKDAETGEINNTAVSGSVHTAILSKSQKQDDSWEFVKWWLDEETQVNYANTLEAVMGSGARYATANPEVLRRLPWSTSQARLLLEQFDKTKGIPDVPGYYMTSRMVDFSFKNVVTEGQNAREALYLNIKDINDELTKKRKEFHLNYIEEEGVGNE